LYYPIYVLGPEERTGLWTQRCIIFLQNNKKTNNINTAGKKVIYKIAKRPRGVLSFNSLFMQNLYWFF